MPSQTIYTTDNDKNTFQNGDYLKWDVTNKKSVRGATKKPLALFDFYASDNTNITSLTQNVWTKFTTFSNPFTISLNHNNEFTVNQTTNVITYIGTVPKLFNIVAIVNILKANGSTRTERDISFQWRLNGVGIGPIRESRSNNNDIEIVSGNGRLLLQNGWYLEPYCMNSENNDDLIVKNFSLNFTEQPMYQINE